MSSSKKEMSVNDSEKVFVAELPENPSKSPVLSSMTTSQPIASLIGVAMISYVNLAEEQRPMPPNLVSNVYAEQRIGGGINLEVQFSTTNFVKRFSLLDGFTFEGIINCDFKGVADKPVVAYPFLHLEAPNVESITKALTTNTPIVGFYRPMAVHDANNHIGLVNFNITKIQDDYCIESITLEVSASLLVSFVNYINDRIRIDSGEFPMANIAGFSVVRTPPAK